MDTYNLLQQYADHSPLILQEIIMFLGGLVVVSIGLITFLCRDDFGKQRWKSVLGGVLGVVIGGLGAGTMCLALHEKSERQYIPDGSQIVQSVEDDLTERYRIEDVRLKSEHDEDRWVYQLKENQWDDRPQVSVLTKEGESLEYEVGFDKHHKVTLYSTGSNQRVVEPEELLR